MHTITHHQLQRLRRIERQRAQLIATAGRLLAQLEAESWTEATWRFNGVYEKYCDLRAAVHHAITQDGET